VELPHPKLSPAMIMSPGFRIAAERGIKIAEQQWQNCSRIRTHYTVSVLACKHLVSVQVVNICIIPYIACLPVLSLTDCVCFALGRIEREELVALVILGSVITPVIADVATVAGEAR
jgi:hypothetical protein